MCVRIILAIMPATHTVYAHYCDGPTDWYEPIVAWALIEEAEPNDFDRLVERPQRQVVGLIMADTRSNLALVDEPMLYPGAFVGYLLSERLAERGV